MADMRGLEEEAERYNPVNPVHNSTRKGFTGIIRGSGATPSAGLSQFRGGMTRKLKKDLEKEAPSQHNAMEDAEAEMPSGEYEGAGKSMSEATAQGLHLGKHLHKLHGGAFYSAFHKGMGMATGGAQTGRYEGEGKLHITHESESESECKGGMTYKGGFWGSLAMAAIPLITSLMGKGMDEGCGKALMKMMKKKRSNGKEKEQIDKMYGEGKMKKAHYNQMMKLFAAPKMKGGASFAPRVVGGAKKAPSSRGALIKKVMAEQKCSLPQASKYIKEHNLK